MKTFKTYFILGLLTYSIGQPLAAQDLNADRMNRDIRIMENVLNEMFKTTQSAGSTSAITLRTGTGNVKGTYLPGYGVILMYESGSSFFIRSTSRSDDNEDSEEISTEFSYSISGASGDSGVDTESIKERIKEFLKDYAPTIGQLKDDENVLVIYKSNSMNDRLFPRVVVNGTVSDDSSFEKIPTISVAAKKSDLNAYKQGKLNENALNDRLTVSESASDEILDLKIFSNILDTGLSENGEDSFRVRGKVSYLLLDNFGALFNMDARYNTRWNVMEVRDERVREALENTVVEGFRFESSEEAEKSREERLKKVWTALDQLKANLKEYIADYGTTLSSVKSDQNIMITVNLGRTFMNNEEFPDRITLQVSKLVLDRLSKGSLSREQAMEQISVMEY